MTLEYELHFHCMRKQRKNTLVEYALGSIQLPFFAFSCLRLEALPNNDRAFCPLSVPAHLMVPVHFVLENVHADL